MSHSECLGPSGQLRHPTPGMQASMHWPVGDGGNTRLFHKSSTLFVMVATLACCTKVAPLSMCTYHICFPCLACFIPYLPSRHACTSTSFLAFPHHRGSTSSGPSAPSGSSSSGASRAGGVVVCDINPQMLEEGRKKAAAASDLASKRAWLPQSESYWVNGFWESVLPDAR